MLGDFINYETWQNAYKIMDYHMNKKTLNNFFYSKHSEKFVKEIKSKKFFYDYIANDKIFEDKELFFSIPYTAPHNYPTTECNYN